MTVKTQQALNAQYADNITGDIIPGNHRDTVDTFFSGDADSKTYTDALESAAVGAFVNAAYGGLRVGDTALPGGVTDAWQVVPLDTQDPVDARFITLDTVGHTAAFDVPGVFLLHVDFSLGHDESNGSRTLVTRIFDATTGAPGAKRLFGVGRNNPATAGAFTTLIRVPPEAVGNVFRLEVTAPDGDLDDTVWVNAAINIVNAGVYEGDITPTAEALWDLRQV